MCVRTVWMAECPLMALSLSLSSRKLTPVEKMHQSRSSLNTCSNEWEHIFRFTNRSVQLLSRGFHRLVSFASWHDRRETLWPRRLSAASVWTILARFLDDCEAGDVFRCGCSQQDTRRCIKTTLLDNVPHSTIMATKAITQQPTAIILTGRWTAKARPRMLRDRH